MLELLQLLISGARAAGDLVAEGRALWQAGASLIEAGHWREAEPPLTQSLAQLEGHLGAAHLDIARVCNSLAIVFYKVWAGHLTTTVMFAVIVTCQCLTVLLCILHLVVSDQDVQDCPICIMVYQLMVH